MRKSPWIASAIVLACVTPQPELASFPTREGAVYSADCCGRPIVQKTPEYPPDAQKRGTTGWVEVSGILDERGWVTDPKVLASDPPGVFDAAALKAFDDWRYATKDSDPSVKREVRAVIPFHVDRPHSAPGYGGSSAGGMSGGGGGGGY